MITGFNFASTPSLHFGAGKISTLPQAVVSYGTRVLLVTGAKSFQQSADACKAIQLLDGKAKIMGHDIIDQEPTPAMIDAIVSKYISDIPSVVVAIGGGSVLDAGKAISAMLPSGESVKDFLEGVGTKTHSGKKIPFIAIPTTSGTGSEATKNAVLSEVGPHGYKRSLRHNNFVPDLTIVDPSLTITCPPSVTAASGMDTFTQLLESYLSTAANPITDALALEGLRLVSTSLLKAYKDGSSIDARSGMSLAAYLSGITLANAGLGLVHGFASSVGGFFPIAHGVICSSLMAEANKITVQKLRSSGTNPTALHKYSVVGKLFSGVENKTNDYYIDFLIAHIASLAEEMMIPEFSQHGMSMDDVLRVVQITDNKNNPAKLNADEMAQVLSASL